MTIDRLNSTALFNDDRTNLQIAQELAKPYGIKVYSEKKGWHWTLMAYTVAATSDISAKDFLGNFTQTFYKRVYLSDKLKAVHNRWGLLCTLPHEFRHSRRFYEEKMFPTKYLGSTVFRTKEECYASVANLTMKMWRWPSRSRSDLVDDVVIHIQTYGIKKSDGDVLRSMLKTHVDIIDQAIEMHNIGLVCPEAARVVNWLVNNGYAKW